MDCSRSRSNDESLHTPLALSNLPWMEVPDDAPAEQEVKPSPPGGFSLVACLLAAGINFAGCFLLAGMRFADGMGSFGTPSTPHFPLAAWLWSPLAMGTYAITGTPPDPASPEFVLISAISFGVFVGYLVGWIRRPIHA